MPKKRKTRAKAKHKAKRVRKPAKPTIAKKKTHAKRPKKVAKTRAKTARKPVKKTTAKQPKKAPKKRTKAPSYKKWSRTYPKALKRKDGSLAMRPSRLRELPAKERRRIREFLEETEEYGDVEDFDLSCYELAEDYEVEVREVYTFWFSE